MPNPPHHTHVTTWVMYAMLGMLQEEAIRQSVGIRQVFQWDLGWLNVVASCLWRLTQGFHRQREFTWMPSSTLGPPECKPLLRLCKNCEMAVYKCP